MFVSAIEKIQQFTRPVHSISRTYGGLILPGTATIFFVNNEGVAITCKHVAAMIPSAEKINAAYQSFRLEKNRIASDGKQHKHLTGLEVKYSYTKEATIQLKNTFLNCFDKLEAITTHIHPTLELAILVFKGFNKILYNGHATFVNEQASIKQGQYLCRIGFPFPEFNNFRYNKDVDDIEWTNTGNPNSPSFPIDGIITRFLGDAGGISGIEMSTPGLKGQSGGPLFDTSGHIYGMQFATNHLHLGFDLRDKEIMNNGTKTKVSNYPFLHVGLCVHVERIKAFLRENGIQFTEAPIN
ncbi:MAG: hypothetical protein Q7T76_06605 [Ferruginibacter sp.]|nr:hypothetical protein [Ferruginibacter sp.]